MDFFIQQLRLFWAGGPRVEEVEKELRAQIERALACGLKPDYLDTHMDSLETKEEFRQVVKNWLVNMTYPSLAGAVKTVNFLIFIMLHRKRKKRS